MKGHRMDFNLLEMLTLRFNGESSVALGLRYDKDHSTILHHCKKHGVSPGVAGMLSDHGFVNKKVVVVEVVVELKPVPKQPVSDKYRDILDPPNTCKGKSYRQYLLESKNRPIEAHYRANVGDAFHIPKGERRI